MTPNARFACSLLGALALCSVGAEFVHERIEDGPATIWLATGWDMARFFTILTNVAIGVAFAAMALNRRWLSDAWVGGLLLWILVVGLVYHILLARDLPVGSLEWWADLGLHTAVPLAVLAVWLGFAPSGGLMFRHAAYWVAWPMLYAAYALLRGMADGEYPYFFLDPTKQGMVGLAIYIAGLGVSFWLGGLVIVGLARVRRLRG